MNPYGGPPANQGPYPQQPGPSPQGSYGGQQQPAFSPQQPGPQQPPFGQPPFGQPPYGQPYPPQAPKKGMSGCMLALLIGGACFLVSGIAIGIFIWSQFGGMLGGLKDVAAVMLDAQSAKGADELREAGCDQAFVIDTKKLEDAVAKVEKEVARKEGRPVKRTELTKDGGHLVQCQVQNGTPPTCEELAKVFVKAAAPKDKFMLTVSPNSGGRGGCTLIFRKDGAVVGQGIAPEIPK